MDRGSDPDNPFSVSGKLSAPKKISQFEKARIEEKQKRLREDEELKRALGEYEDIFDERASKSQHGHNDDGRLGSHGSGRPRDRGRFDQPFSAGPPPSMKRKREMQHAAEREDSYRRDDYQQSDRQSRRSWSPDNSDEDRSRNRPAKRHSPEPSFRKPTMLLQFLPKSITKSELRSAMPASIKVEDVRLVTPTDRRDAERYMSAFVSTSMTTPTSELDKAVSQIQDKYVGFGCYVKASRHVASSGKLGNIDTSVLGLNTKHPFGATQPSVQEQKLPAYRDVPPSSMNRMPPPSNFAQTGPPLPKQSVGPLTVSVSTPTDIRLLRLIHSTAEQVIDHGADFEAMLMAQPSVQKDEKWAWLFESYSKASAYYRWLLWDALSGSETKPPEIIEMFDVGPVWKAPGQAPRYASVLDVEDICHDDDYVSSDEDDSEDETTQRDKARPPGRQVMNIDEVGEDSQAQYLNPARRAKLTHLLARIPESMAMLRCGDVARVSHFVVNNAGNGAEEIIDMLISNLEHPFRHAVKYANEVGTDEQPTDEKTGEEKRDQSGLQLIALYLISDVLLASSTAGVSNAWKYRNLFEAALLSRQVFERLGRLEKVYGWGRMKSEQWKRKIIIVLDIWTERSVFTTEALKQMRIALMEPPMTAGERAEKAEEAKPKWIATADSASTPAKEPPSDEIKADVARRVAAMQANIAASKAKATADNATSVTASSEANSVAPPPVWPEKQSSGGFSFALPGTSAAAAKPSGGIGFSLKAASPPPPPSHASSSKPTGAGVFGDDDSDG